VNLASVELDLLARSTLDADRQTHQNAASAATEGFFVAEKSSVVNQNGGSQ
jgi:hypothetical protein